MLPLGGYWTGACRVPAGAPCEPGENILNSLCNLGYARGVCARFPEGDGPDAVRFSVSQDDGSSIRVYYAIERDHHPFAHGPLEYSRAKAGFVARPAGAAPETGDRIVRNEIVCTQAGAYVASYLRRKSEPSAA